MKSIILCILVSIVLLSTPALAYDQPAVNLGATSFVDGGPPSGPGWYYQGYLQYYITDTLNDGPPSNDIDVLANLNQLIYQSNQELLAGGKWGLNLILPVVHFESEVNPWVPDNGGGIGDLLVGPYLQWDPIMGEKGPIFMHRIELSVILPTGKYDETKALNPGSNVISFNPYWSGTFFITPKWTASTRIHYLWNAKNDDPFVALGATDDSQAGQAIHANFATSYEVVPKMLRLGINGYALKQITSSEVDGNKVPGKEQVLAIGPGALVSFSKDTHLFLNAYFETETDSRPEGERYNIRLVQHF